METDRLIENLGRDLQPVRRLRPAARRVAAWFAVAFAAGAVVVLASGPRPELAAHFADPAFTDQVLAALVAALLAAWAALAVGVPGGTQRWTLWLPAAPLAWWLAALGHQCWQVWLRLGPGGITLNPELDCFASIALVGAVPAIAIVAMIRRGARFRATAALLWGSLAVALFANAAHLLFHEGDAGLLGVMVQIVSVTLIVGGAAVLRRKLMPEATA